MIRALVAGRKTQTRRIVKPQSIIPQKNEFGRHPSWLKMQAPYGQPGDRLWVRETWAPAHFTMEHPNYAYRADGEFLGIKKWRPLIHMPQSASRFTLEITNVRVERVQDISEEDAIAEGFYRHPETKQFELTCNRNDWVWVYEFKKL